MTTIKNQTKHIVDILKKEGTLKHALNRYKFMNKSLSRQALFRLIHSIRKAPFLYQLNGFKMFLNPRDLGLSKELFVVGIREPVCQDKYKQLLMNNDVIIDIGANLGYYVLIASQKVDTGFIHAIEPIPDNYTLLARNIVANGLGSRVKTYNCAIGDNNKKEKIYYGKELNTPSILRADHPNYFYTDVFTLDRFIFTNDIKPTVVRMDVEGFEYQIINGMKNILKNNTLRVLFIEFHPRILYDNHLEISEIFRTIFNHGFKVEVVVKEDSSYDEYQIICDYNKVEPFMRFLRQTKLLYPESKRAFGAFFIRGCK